MFKVPASPPKVTHQEYEKPGFQDRNTPFREHKDSLVRGMERDGLHRTVTQHGSPMKGYNTATYEGAKNPPKNNKISGMPPHENETYGEPENRMGMGRVRNGFDSGKG